MKYKCKHKEIADEINSRTRTNEAIVDESIESFVYMDEGCSDDFNMVYDVLLFLGYAKPIETKFKFDSIELGVGSMPKTEGAYYK
ncbi:hypothetical protein [Vibrio phage 2E1]|nr:hypothetical protein [Vibrio phage 2E1]